ncbi:MAG TPA: sigma-70 family RNA polymerase sigma factor [Solirubrobacterales bacterium]|nr:sigma-70 family RNA polymerase sigma factor [Solirubrobacterales bacterium]
MSEFGDERLARRAAAGDRRAFEQIYRRYNQQLYRFCLAVLGDPHDAQDALQNAMVKVLRALPGEQRQIKLKPWLYRIARNEAVETLRRRREHPKPDLEQAAPSAAQIAERAEDRERLRTLFADLEALPERQRGALIMRELSGLSFEEIAEAFETSPATARQTVYEARLSLRQMEEGREMRCEEVMRALSDADGRLRRRRNLRAHLRGCPSCRAFADEMDERRSELAALAPLPLVASAGVLHGALGQAQGGVVAGGAAGAAGSAGTSGSLGIGAGKAIATSTVAKSAATVAVAAVVGVSAADRTGLIDAGLPGPGSATKTSGAGSKSVAVHRAARPGDSAGRAAGQSNPQASGEQSPQGARGAPAAPLSSSPDSPGSAPDTPPGQSGSAPSQGHGHGKAKGKGSGKPDTLPAASAHGQQTASAHKAPQANASPPGHRQGAGRPHPKGKGNPAADKAPASPPSAQKPASPPAGGSITEGVVPSPPADPSIGAEHGPDGGAHTPFQR